MTVTRGSVRTQNIRPHDWEVRVRGPRGPVCGAERVEARAKQVESARAEWRMETESAAIHRQSQLIHQRSE